MSIAAPPPRSCPACATFRRVGRGPGSCPFHSTASRSSAASRSGPISTWSAAWRRPDSAAGPWPASCWPTTSTPGTAPTCSRRPILRVASPRPDPPALRGLRPVVDQLIDAVPPSRAHVDPRGHDGEAQRERGDQAQLAHVEDVEEREGQHAEGDDRVEGEQARDVLGAESRGPPSSRPGLSGHRRPRSIVKTGWSMSFSSLRRAPGRPSLADFAGQVQSPAPHAADDAGEGGGYDSQGGAHAPAGAKGGWRWDHSQVSGSSSWPASDPDRWGPCSSGTWAPTSSASTASSRPRWTAWPIRAMPSTTGAVAPSPSICSTPKARPLFSAWWSTPTG